MGSDTGEWVKDAEIWCSRWIVASGEKMGCHIATSDAVQSCSNRLLEDSDGLAKIDIQTPSLDERVMICHFKESEG